MLAFAAVDWSGLWEVIWVSTLVGTGVSAVFSLIILGSARAAESRREGHGAAAALYGTLAAVAFAAFAVGIVIGVIILLSK